MMKTPTMTEAQIAKAARKIARKATRLAARGDHAGAKRMVDEAMRNVIAMRAAGLVRG